MDIISVQNCVSTQPYFTAHILSESTPGKVYEILVPMPGDPPEQYICTCPGFEFRGYCKHQHQVQICGWEELTGPEKQTLIQKKAHTCPRCKNDTVEELEYADD